MEDDTRLFVVIGGCGSDLRTLRLRVNIHAALACDRWEGYEFTRNRREIRIDLAELEMKHVIFSGSVSPDGEKHRIKEENPA